MLLHFEVENFLSFKQRQVFSLVASNYYNDHESALICADVPSLRGLSYLPVAAMFGPNASGKSNFFKAIEQLKVLVLNSAVVAPNLPLPYSPFMLDEHTKNEPTQFAISFTISGIRYDYEIAYDAGEIVFEELLTFPKGRKQTVFTRRAQNLDDGMRLHPQVEVNQNLKVNPFMISTLRENVLFLSLGAQLNNSKLLEVYTWFKDEIQLATTSGLNMDAFFNYSTEVLSGKLGELKRLSFIDKLQKADFGIDSVRVEYRPMPQEALEALKVVVSDEMYSQVFRDEKSYANVFLKHGNDKNSVELNINEDSAGIKQFFSLLGPLLDVLDKGLVLIVDEFDASLHPMLAEFLVKLFMSSDTNPNSAQLIVATHNMCLLSNTTLRRDQIWFTEKGSDGASHLYPLSDYRPRKDESLLTGYFKGRYGALPLFPEHFFDRAGTDS